MHLFLFLCLISRLMVFVYIKCHIRCWQNPSVLLAWREARLFSRLPHCLEFQGCHLIPSFHHLIFCLVMLLILSSIFFCFWPSLLSTFQKFLETFPPPRDRLFFWVLPLFSGFFYRLGDNWSVVSVACYIMALVLAIHAFRHVCFLISWCLSMFFFLYIHVFVNRYW